MKNGAVQFDLPGDILAMAQYLCTHAILTTREEVHAFLSAKVVQTVLNAQTEERSVHDAQRKLQEEAVRNLPPDWLGHQAHAPLVTDGWRSSGVHIPDDARVTVGRSVYPKEP